MASSSKGRLTSIEKPKKRRLIDYPRHGRRGFKRWIPSWRFVLGTFLTFFALGAGLLIAAYNSVEIPEPNDFAMAQTTTVYYADGKTVMGQFSQTDRTIIEDGNSLPKYVGQAVVAAEDRTFYENSGVDLKGMARAFYINITQNKRQGGSTITQQYADNYFLDDNNGYIDKVKEVLLSLKLSRVQDKDDILLGYMNTIYFGRGAFGIEVAANRYFGKAASELTVEEAALIAGVIPSPTNWDPRNSPKDAERRFNYVLDGMVTLGYLDATERASMVMPETKEYSKSNKFAGPQGYLLETIRKEVLQLPDMDEDKLETRGYSIVSTFDYDIQKKLEEAAKTLPEDAPKNLQLGGVTIDPHSGAVLAMYGGEDYLEKQFNSVTQGSAQAGSTFKPFTLLAGLKEGISVENKYYNGNSPRTFKQDNGKEYKLGNFGGYDYGHVNLVKATANSVNTAYVELNQEVGPQATVDAAISVGIPKDTPGLDPVLSNVLGTSSVHPIDMASAYATFAASGQHYDVHTVQKVTDSHGDNVFEPSIVPTRAYSDEIGAELTYALSQVVEKGSGDKALSIGHPIAGKTGTSNDNYSAWFVGYTPSYATAISLYQSGADGSQEMIEPFGGYREITGSTVPLDIWVEYMGAVLDGTEIEEFPERTLKQTQKPRPTQTQTPTEEPSEEPTPTETPTPDPTETPTPDPTPTETPTPDPTETPTPDPTPTETPTPDPTEEPSTPPGGGTDGGGTGGTGGTGGGTGTGGGSGTTGNQTNPGLGTTG